MNKVITEKMLTRAFGGKNYLIALSKDDEIFVGEIHKIRITEFTLRVSLNWTIRCRKRSNGSLIPITGSKANRKALSLSGEIKIIKENPLTVEAEGMILKVSQSIDIIGAVVLNVLQSYHHI